MKPDLLDLQTKRAVRARAVRAYCQWHLGDYSWGHAIMRIIESDDPIDEAEMECDGETVDEILRGVEMSGEKRGLEL